MKWSRKFDKKIMKKLKRLRKENLIPPDVVDVINQNDGIPLEVSIKVKVIVLE